MADMKTQSEFVADFVKFVQDAKKAGKTARVKADAEVIWGETK